MIRFLVICTVFFIAYLGFTTLGCLDSKVVITVYDYYFETKLFTLAALMVIAVLLVLVMLKMITLMVELPWLIKNKLASKRMQRATNVITKAMVDLLINDKLKAIEEIKKLDSNLSVEQRELFELIKAETAIDFEQKIECLRNLGASKNYNYFGIKRLSQVFYENGFYEQALDCAIKAFNSNETDSDILEILINCYAKLGLWSKFTFIVSKLAEIDQKRLLSMANKISEYNLLAAKTMLELGEDNEVMNYIESSLEFNPVDIEALDLYYALNLNLNQAADNLEILEEAFISAPCFEIAEIYIRVCDLQPQEIYDNLARLVDQKQYYHIFLAIAAYLDLPEKIQGLKSPKLLPPPVV